MTISDMGRLGGHEKGGGEQWNAIHQIGGR